MRRFCLSGKPKDVVSSSEDQDPAADAGNPHNSPPAASKKMRRFFCLCFGGETKEAVSRNEDQNPAADAHNPPVASNTGVLDQNVGASASTSNPSANAVIYSYDELAKVTNNFDKESIIGEGGFGLVYKGTFEATGQMVAVKRLNLDGHHGNEEFQMEVDMLSHLRHPNIVNLIGYCSKGAERLLVYELMPLKSLDKHLFVQQQTESSVLLDWQNRMKIAAGIASGLNYLHNKAVIFRDLKAGNILLDESFSPKLCDFGTAKSSDKSHVNTREIGTPGYMAPEYLGTGNLSTKCDVYSFGAILVALITGRPPKVFLRSPDDPLQLHKWLLPKISDRGELYKVVDSVVGDGFDQISLDSAAKLALACIDNDPDVRPTMEEVLQRMNVVVSQAGADRSGALTIGEGSGSKETTSVMRVEDDLQLATDEKAKARIEDDR